jgi:predicted GH43/DUF377 family glycosyl hydrolase
MKKNLIILSMIFFALSCFAQQPAETTMPMPKDLQTPYKLGRILISPGGQGQWDAGVDCPFVFYHKEKFYMIYLGHDGIGYQTGIASSSDLINWSPGELILKRDPNNPVIKYNIALSWILRENDLFSKGELKKVNGQYVGVYHAYPDPGGEEGSAVIGLCWTKDFKTWKVDDPFLTCEGGAWWERGGLYKPCLVEEKGTYYLVYNAKTVQKPGVSFFDGGWNEQIGMAWSKDLKHWTRFEGSPIIRNGGSGSLDERVAGDPCVYRYGKQWAIYYYCVDGQKGKIGVHDRVALSSDLKSAVKCEGSLIDQGPKGSFDEKWAAKPYVIFYKGVLYHFYKAESDGKGGGITVATSKPLTNSTK